MFLSTHIPRRAHILARTTSPMAFFSRLRHLHRLLRTLFWFRGHLSWLLDTPSLGMCSFRYSSGRREHQLDRVNLDRKSTRLNSSHLGISYAVFCLKKKDI